MIYIAITGRPDFLAFVNEDKRDGFYFNDYGFLRATFGVTLGSRRN